MSNLHHSKTIWYKLVAVLWEINCTLSISCRHWETCGIPGRYDLWVGLYRLCLYALCNNWECCIPQQCLIKYSLCPWGFLLSSSGTLSCDSWYFATNQKFISFLEVFCVSLCSTCDKNILCLQKKEQVCLCQRMAWANAPRHTFFSCMWHRTLINRKVIWNMEILSLKLCFLEHRNSLEMLFVMVGNIFFLITVSYV